MCVVRRVHFGWLVRDARFTSVARVLFCARDRETHLVSAEGGSATLPFPLTCVFVHAPGTG